MKESNWYVFDILVLSHKTVYLKKLLTGMEENGVERTKKANSELVSRAQRQLPAEKQGKSTN
jgi:NurA-like 5'-3' nuclease